MRPITELEALCHALKQQLTVAKGELDFFIDIEAPQMRDRLQRVEAALTRAVELCDAAVANEQAKVIDLRHMLKQWSAEKQRNLTRPSCVALSCLLPEGPCHVRLVPTEFHEMMETLFDNACAAVAGNGQIEVILAEHEADEQYVNGCIHLTVLDTGAGIPPEIQPKIFTPRFTTKASGHGTGLARAKQIMQQRSGHIAFTSVPGEGTTFTLTFPRVKS